MENPDNTIYDLIEILYDESSKLKEMGKEIIRTNILGKQENETIENIKNRLVKMLEEFLMQLKKERKLKISKSREKRLIHLLLLSIIDFSKEFPCEREENISFINEIFWSLAGQ
ncbi:hypothetical protein [Halothermothrix orenii]|uniref:Uncharacterized protein n=1 Tax=Halothermothrix orenii (strain H 168 / OCM 544 / DSM 9562) TaxID=373903 RepID=B8D1X0_HALOH|nr:hypothetical protein [Halothermothrix orenii]ACL69197.1 hypothetical protein Hore_04390 [Halothermothrix orenii H 168]